MCSCFLDHAGTIYEGTTNIQLTTIAKFIDQEYDQWDDYAYTFKTKFGDLLCSCYSVSVIL